MKYTIEERLNIVKQVYDNLISKYDASVKYDVSLTTSLQQLKIDTQWMNEFN